MGLSGGVDARHRRARFMIGATAADFANGDHAERMHWPMVFVFRLFDLSMSYWGQCFGI